MARRRIVACLLIGAALPARAAPTPDPTRIPGGSVIHTEALAALLHHGAPVLIDVAPAPRRPPNSAAGAVWLPLPHPDIPGSHWIPGAGLPTLPPDLDRFYRRRLADLSANDFGRTIVVYCHPHCRLSLTAAQRAIGYGYGHVDWYPDGVEGWSAAHQPTAAARPETPDAN